MGPVKHTAVRAIGLLATALYAGFIAWVYAYQPKTVEQLKGGIASTVGAYEIDRVQYNQGLQFFRNDQFEEARAALGRADPARLDATTQFYIAYSYYRQGWGRVYNDDALFQKGLEAVDRAIEVAPGHRLDVSDPAIEMRTADELRAELNRGLTREPADLNPMRIFRRRK
jgi:tetratricopeptide (TPR) repeat protein